jgi:hypothetical protein
VSRCLAEQYCSRIHALFDFFRGVRGIAKDHDSPASKAAIRAQYTATLPNVSASLPHLDLVRVSRGSNFRVGSFASILACPRHVRLRRNLRAKHAKAAGMSQRLARCVAMWCDAQRRVVERCDAPRRAALPTVMSISPTRPIDQPNMVGCEATSRQRSCRSRHLFRIASPCSSQDPPRVRTHAAESSLRRPRRVSPRGHRTEPENPCASIHRSTRRAPARAIA